LTDCSLQTNIHGHGLVTVDSRMKDIGLGYMYDEHRMAVATSFFP